MLKTKTPVLGFLVAAGLAGCAASPKADLSEATAAYHRGQYSAAYELARPIADGSSKPGQDAAYIAGLSAQRLGRMTQAVRYLSDALRSNDDTLAGDAGAALGLIYSQQGNYASAARVLDAAAPKLVGEDRAKAYYYLAVAQQKLGRTADARTSFRLAQTATSDRQLRQRIAQQRAAIGWTVQTGAYRKADNARTAANALARRVRGATPRLVQADDNRGGTLILLQIGHFTTHDSARRFADQLGQDAVVVPVAR